MDNKQLIMDNYSLAERSRSRDCDNSRPPIFFPLEPRRLLLFLSAKKVNKKTVSAESASLKIGSTSLKVRNLFPFHFNFKQTDFLRFVSPIFLTLTSQGGNQGMLTSCRELKVRQGDVLINNFCFGRFLSIFMLAIITTIFFPSCIKTLEKEGIYETTLCSGVLLDQRTNNPVVNARVILTDGELMPVSVVSGSDGEFEIEVDCDLAGKGYFLSIEADSLYESRTISLEGMGFGRQTYEIGSVYVVGPEVPIVVTLDVSAVTASSAHCGGNVTDGGKSEVTERGLCWSTMQYPTPNDNFVRIGNGTGQFDATIDGLHYNTTYYIRAYARNGIGIGYGQQLSFTTADGLATVVTATATGITPTSATCGGNVTDDGGFAVTARGVCWSTTMQPTITNSHTTDGTGLGAFVSSVTNLEPNTTYYLRAYATTEAGTAYGEQISFATPNGLATVTTADVTGVTANSATCGGSVSADGGFAVTARGVCYSTTPNPTIAGPHTTDGAGLGTFVSQLYNLNSATTYYVRAYATNGAGTVYGEEKDFRTE